MHAYVRLAIVRLLIDLGFRLVSFRLVIHEGIYIVVSDGLPIYTPWYLPRVHHGDTLPATEGEIYNSKYIGCLLAS